MHSGGQPVRLTNTEFDLLAYFMNHPGQVLDRQQILRAVWGYGHDPATNIVDVYIGYLRRKLASGSRPDPIVTVRSHGYRLEGHGMIARTSVRWRLVAWVTGVLLAVRRSSSWWSTSRPATSCGRRSTRTWPATSRSCPRR